MPEPGPAETAESGPEVIDTQIGGLELAELIAEATAAAIDSAAPFYAAHPVLQEWLERVGGIVFTQLEDRGGTYAALNMRPGFEGARIEVPENVVSLPQMLEFALHWAEVTISGATAKELGGQSVDALHAALEVYNSGRAENARANRGELLGEFGIQMQRLGEQRMNKTLSDAINQFKQTAKTSAKQF